MCAEMKQERTKLLEQEKLRMASKRRYAAQQFLIQQEEQRDELERSAMSKVRGLPAILQTRLASPADLRCLARQSMEMANLSMGNVTKSFSYASLDGQASLTRLSTPIRREIGRLTPIERKRKKGASKAGRHSPLPVWTWAVGGAGGAMPKFVK